MLNIISTALTLTLWVMEKNAQFPVKINLCSGINGSRLAIFVNNNLTVAKYQYLLQYKLYPDISALYRVVYLVTRFADKSIWVQQDKITFLRYLHIWRIFLNSWMN